MGEVPVEVPEALVVLLVQEWRRAAWTHRTGRPLETRSVEQFVADRVRARLVALADQWEDLIATQSEIMTTPQRNAWRDALAELRGALLCVAATDGQAPSLRHAHDAHARVEERRRVAALIRKNAATLDSFAREGSTAGLIAYLIDNVMAAPEGMGGAVLIEPGRPDQDGRDLGTGRDGQNAPTSPARTSHQPQQEFCGTLPGHPPHGNCGGYPPSPTGPTCSECGKPRSDDPESEEGISGMCLRCLLGPLPSEMDSQA